MEAINKNKEEIEKLEKEIRMDIDIRLEKRKKGDIGQTLGRYNLEDMPKSKLQATIKTSILWCEDEIEFYNENSFRDWAKQSNDRVYLRELNCVKIRLQQLQTHLTWLKEQEKQNGRN